MTTETTTQTTTTILYTLRGGIYAGCPAGITDGRFVVRPEPRTEHVAERVVVGIFLPAHDAEVPGFDVWDREAGTVAWVQFDGQGQWVKELERLTKVRGAVSRRWRLRNQ